MKRWFFVRASKPSVTVATAVASLTFDEAKRIGVILAQHFREGVAVFRGKDRRKFYTSIGHPTHNPSLIAHGLAAVAKYHIVAQGSRIPIADLYAVSQREAHDIGQAMADALRTRVSLLDNKLLPASLHGHPRTSFASRRNPGGPRIVYNKLLGGWYVVVGPHQTPINGRFESKAAAQAWLAMRAAKRNPVAPRVGDRWRQLGGGMVTVKAVTPHRVQVLDTSGNREWIPRGDFSVSYRPNPGRVTLTGRSGQTLARWQTKHGIKFQTHKSGARHFPHALIPQDAYRELFHLTDYAVSSVAAGTVWLVAARRNPGRSVAARTRRAAARKIRRTAKRARRRARVVPGLSRLYPRVAAKNPRRVRLDAATRAHLEAWLRSQRPRECVAARARIYRALRDDPELVERGRGWSEIERLGEPNPRRRARRLKNPSTLAEAKKTFRRWHAFDAHKVVAVKGPDRVIPKTLVRLGELREVVYSSDKWGGRAKLYVHKTGRPHPILATDPKGRHVHVVGGRMRPTADGLVG